MANLPTKVPNIMHQDSHQQQRQEFLHPHHQDDQQSQNPPWVDEFIEFSAARRGTHRSDSLVEGGSIPFLREHVNVTEIDKNNNEVEFDKFDEEQFMSMFSKEFGRSTSDPSSTSDNNSTNDSQKRPGMTRKEKGLRRRERVEDGEKAEEVESLRKFDKDEGQVNHRGGNAATSDGTMIGCVDQKQQQSTIDPKRVRRILANRQSAQRSRVRKLQYISELERSVTTLQSEVSALSPRVAFLGHQRIILTYDNNSLKAKIAAFAQDKIFKDAHQEAMKREIERLRQVYYNQNLDKETDSTIPPSTSLSIPLTAQPSASPSDPTVNKNDHLNG